jgi:hypothetical protein
MRVLSKHWRPSPGTAVIATAACVISLLLALNWLSARRSRFNAQVEIAAPLVETASAKSPANPSTQILPDGEVERTAIRVREVSALVIGLTLFVVNEGLAKRPITSVEALTDRFASNGLLPPGIARREAKGVLSSDRATIYVRYRPEPLAIEVVSLGHEPLDGPAIIGRIVSGGDEYAGAELFIARQLGNVILPEPFAANAQVAAMNWSVEPLRERNLAPQELEQLNHWLRTEARLPKQSETVR